MAVAMSYGFKKVEKSIETSSNFSEVCAGKKKKKPTPNVLFSLMEFYFCSYFVVLIHPNRKFLLAL